ncbi:MAG: class II fructose-bisphosphate aldolase [bacterium]|nr:class II fructose-bisphosphate aldolase [bacterium]
MRTLREVLRDAERRGVAVGHFNISEIGALKAIAEVAKELKLPVIVGTSEGEREFLDIHDAVALVRDLREKHGQEIYLNADHTKSLEKIKEAVNAGYDAVLFDGGALPLEKNIEITKAVVKYVREFNKGILVEGELGNIGSGSTIRKELPKGAAIKPEDLTHPEDAVRFVKETGVDLLAPAVGNIHGMFANAPEPALNIDRIREIKDATGIPLVLHGGSGNTDADFLAAIAVGVRIIHISTELRLAWRKGMEATLKDKPDEVAPYKLMEGSIEEMKKVLTQRLKLFNHIK